MSPTSEVATSATNTIDQKVNQEAVEAVPLHENKTIDRIITQRALIISRDQDPTDIILGMKPAQDLADYFLESSVNNQAAMIIKCKGLSGLSEIKLFGMQIAVMLNSENSLSVYSRLV